VDKQEAINKKTRVSAMGLGTALGLLFGGLLGLLIDNLAFLAGGGMVVGLALGLAIDKQRQNQ
jgi:F0F1-type ATP synthase assembly protein I